MATDANTSYGQFIQEAFIDPIRSVLIIDDEYPTIEQILLSQINKQPLTEYKRPELIRSVINGFRKDNPARIVDIHDGVLDDEDSLAKYLHQSDLLILDYELQDKGEKSTDIVRKVFSNNHFNLIVVHTWSDPVEPFKSVLHSFLSPCKSLDCEKVTRGGDLIETAEGSDPDMGLKIRESIRFQQYISLRHPSGNCSARGALKGVPPFNKFNDLVQKVGWKKDEPSSVLCWALDQYEQDNKAQLCSDTDTLSINWSLDFSGPLWIRTNRGFITFVQKRDGINLIDELKGSLIAWKPSPSRLLSAKLRAAIEDCGVIAEDQVLSNKHLHAKFYADAFKEDNFDARRTKIDSQISRKISDITHLIKCDVAEYFSKIMRVDEGNGKISSYQAHYGVDLSNSGQSQKALQKFNAYISCYPSISGWHLAPGHVLDIDNEKWVCLSPVCDLVPGQKDKGVYGVVGSGKPFFAVKLHIKTGKLNPGQINSNNFVFIPDVDDESKIDQYGFYEQSVTDPDKTISPHWHLFVASDGGKFGSDFSLSISRMDCEDDALKVCVTSGKIIAQLRYEYALNLMQKLGGDFTRVGLEYISS